jgi:hypothetical protein
MKTYLVLAVVTSGVALAAENPPLPTFGGQTIEVPTLSLAEKMKQPPLFGGQTPPRAGWFLGEPKPAPVAARRQEQEKVGRLVSRMPIITPRADVDPAMPIKGADAAIDPKMVKKPEIAPTR